MEVFYKGADILLELALWVDQHRSQAINLSSYDVDALLYSGGDQMIHLTSGAGGTIKLEITGSSIMRATISREAMLDLGCGVVHVDLRLVDRISGLSVVDTSTAFILEDSRIKDV